MSVKLGSHCIINIFELLIYLKKMECGSIVSIHDHSVVIIILNGKETELPHTFKTMVICVEMLLAHSLQVFEEMYLVYQFTIMARSK